MSREPIACHDDAPPKEERRPGAGLDATGIARRALVWLGALFGGLAAVALLVVGCAVDPHALPTETCVDRDGDGRGAFCAGGFDCDDADPLVTTGCQACRDGEPGCPCAVEGAERACGVPATAAPDGTVTTCSYGTQTCVGGSWSACDTARPPTDPAFGAGMRPQGYGTPNKCPDNPCNPYCTSVVDTAGPEFDQDGGPGYNPDSGGMTMKKGGELTFPDDNDPYAPPTQEDWAAIQDGGATPPDGSSYIFHELVPGQTATDPIVFDTKLPTADVYFLMDDTGSMREEAFALFQALTDGAGIIETLKNEFGALVEFGVGRFGEYNQTPYNAFPDQVPQPFDHVLSMQADKQPAKDAAKFVHDSAFGTAGTTTYRGNSSFPESATSALWTSITDIGNNLNGLYRSSTAWWAKPRNAWKSAWAAAPAGNNGACTDPTRWGYPCWRANTTPVYILFTDAPSHNGPGGWYQYPQVAGQAVAGATMFPPATAFQGASTFGAAPVLDPAVFGLYHGTVLVGLSQSQVGTGSTRPRDCPQSNSLTATSSGALSTEAIYKLTVTKRTYYHFSLLVSNGTHSTTLGAFLYLKASPPTSLGGVIDCNHNAANLGLEVYARSEINSFLDPGTYYLVIDSSLAETPFTYLLQVGAFDDGSPYAAPSYQQAVNALNKRNGKVIAVESSGVSCGQTPTSQSQHETKPYLEKLAIDTGSIDGTTGKPFVISLRSNATDCATGSNNMAMRDAVKQAVGSFATTLRQDVYLRAVDAKPPPASSMLPPSPGGPPAFVQSVEAVPDANAAVACNGTGTDSLGYGYFKNCMPGSPITFKVTFQVPDTIKPKPYDQYFRFDVVLLGNLVTELRRIAVIIKVPKGIDQSSEIMTRDYDATTICPAGTYARWSYFWWDSTTPMTSNTNYSRIEFSVQTAETQADLDTAPLDPLGLASLVPTDTQKSYADIFKTLQNNGRPLDAMHLRIKMEFRSSKDGTQVPTLYWWKLWVDCLEGQ